MFDMFEGVKRMSLIYSSCDCEITHEQQEAWGMLKMQEEIQQLKKDVASIHRFLEATLGLDE